MRLLCLPILFVLFTPALAHERENTALQPHLQSEEPSLSVLYSATWESRYYLEGRDSLDGASILSQTLELEWESLVFGVWYGNATGQRYDELHTSLLYHHDFGNSLEGYLGYNHVRFPHGDGHHDHEIHTGISYAGLPQDIELALDAYHSFEADGFFAELSAGREWELTEELSTSLTAMFGVNQGYVSDGHDGANHIAASWGLAYSLSEALSIVGHATYNWGIDRKAGAPDDAALKDFFHAGVGLELSF